MFTIRNAQLAVLLRLPFDEFVERRISHLHDFYPQECEALGPAQLKLVVEAAIDRAKHRGYQTEQDIARYLSLAMLLGSHFDSDPQLDWAHHDSSSKPEAHLAAVWHSTMSYLDRCAGPSNEYLVRAMLRLRRLDFVTLASIDPDATKSTLEEIAQWLAALYPEKAQEQGPKATLVVVDQSVGEASSYRLTSLRGISLVAAAKFMLGAGCFHDPLFPWLQSFARDEAEPESTRDASLYQLLMKFLEWGLKANRHAASK